MPTVLNALPLLFALSFPASQDAPLPDAAELLARVEQALGPADVRAAVKNRRLRGRASWEGLPGEGTFEETFQGADHARLSTVFDEFGLFSLGRDGDVVWENRAGEAIVKTGWDACADLRRYGMIRGAAWDTLYESARTVGRERVGEVECWKLELVPRALVPVPERASGRAPVPDVWFVATDTHLPRRVDVHHEGPERAVVEAVVHTLDWRDVAGQRYAHRRKIEVSGLALVLDVEAVEHDVVLPADFFDPGDDVRAAAERGDGPAGTPEIRIVELEETHVASVRVTCPANELQGTFAIIFDEVMRHLQSAGVAMGTVFARYHAFGAEIDVEAGMQVPKAVPGAGRVEAGTLPAGPAAVAWHIGPYPTLSETHARLATWLDAEGWAAAGAPWEEYVTDPGLEPDSSKWRTRVVQPVRKR